LSENPKTKGIDIKTIYAIMCKNFRVVIPVSAHSPWCRKKMTTWKEELGFRFKKSQKPVRSPQKFESE